MSLKNLMKASRIFKVTAVVLVIAVLAAVYLVTRPTNFNEIKDYGKPEKLSNLFPSGNIPDTFKVTPEHNFSYSVYDTEYYNEDKKWVKVPWNTKGNIKGKGILSAFYADGYTVIGIDIDKYIRLKGDKTSKKDLGSYILIQTTTKSAN